MSRGATARLFVAVDPPVSVCEELADWARGVVVDARPHGGGLDGLRVLAASSLHLTLCFLGSRPVSEIDALAAAVGDCDEHACELSVGAPLWLPTRRPRALAVEIHDRGGELACVHARLTGALSRVMAGSQSGAAFRPHITLIRVAPRRWRRAPSRFRATEPRAVVACHAVAWLHTRVDCPVPLVACSGGRQL